jgi:hypothetical protein
LFKYIEGGCEISLVIGIDFTVSNKDPSDPASLHYIDPIDKTAHNQYQQAILSVGKILEEYDTDKKYPVYGFGGKMKKLSNKDDTFNPTLFCFPLHNENEEVHGIDGVLEVSL